MRKEIIAGNWKMNKTVSETKQYFEAFADKLDTEKREVCLFVPFLSLSEALENSKNTKLTIGAQNMYFEESGAFTGEVSADMLKDIGIINVLIGHSERRQYFAETDETVNLKVKKAIEKGIRPFVCFGENLEQREKGEETEVLAKQLKSGLVDTDITKLVVAYEPVWAIGTGKTATSDQAQQMCAFIRKTLVEMFGKAAEGVQILYGGSVNAGNIKDIMAMPDIDGVLVGGASLKQDFVSIANYDEQ